MPEIAEGTLLWEPPAGLRDSATITRYLRWLEHTHNRVYESYAELWAWSATDIEAFWASIWEFFDVHSYAPYQAVLGRAEMPGAAWFPGARLNYAEHIFRSAAPDRPALVFASERHAPVEWSWDELSRRVASVAETLRELGVEPGDRVAAYVPNIPEAAIALFACASIGAIWSSCSPDFGSPSVVDRFAQIEPKILFACDGYVYNGKRFDRRDTVAELQRALPTVQTTVLVPYLDPETGAGALDRTLLWNEVAGRDAELRWEPLAFDHPLWILYSSGTTGLPKPIVQGHGGILLEHLKHNALQMDLGPGDRFFWYTTTGWMMWNLLLGGLLVGATVLLYDGSPAAPDMDALWSFAEQSGMTVFGTSAGYLTACLKAGIRPGERHHLDALRCVGSTGSPLPPEGFAWVYEHVKPDIWLASVSGGTDLCTAFVGSCPLLPVYAGELQARCLGAAVQAYDEHGQACIDQVGELVIERPMPSMPLYFWNDAQLERYRESYFETFRGVWRHGDWIKITPRGTAIIYGRSDSTINRQGVRMGTSELYRVVDGDPRDRRQPGDRSGRPGRPGVDVAVRRIAAGRGARRCPADTHPIPAAHSPFAAPCA